MRIESVRIEASGMATIVAAGGFSFCAPCACFEAAGIDLSRYQGAGEASGGAGHVSGGGATISTEGAGGSSGPSGSSGSSGGQGGALPAFAGAAIGDEEAERLYAVWQGWAARQTALRLCARAEQYSAGLSIKLIARGFPKPLAQAVIAELVAQGLVDDSRFARSWAAARLARRSLNAATGPALLTAELRAKGLGKEAVQAALAEFPIQLALRRAIKVEARRFSGDQLRHRLRALGYSSTDIDEAIDASSTDYA